MATAFTRREAIRIFALGFLLIAGSGKSHADACKNYRVGQDRWFSDFEEMLKAIPEVFNTDISAKIEDDGAVSLQGGALGAETRKVKFPEAIRHVIPHENFAVAYAKNSDAQYLYSVPAGRFMRISKNFSVVPDCRGKYCTPRYTYRGAEIRWLDFESGLERVGSVVREDNVVHQLVGNGDELTLVRKSAFDKTKLVDPSSGKVWEPKNYDCSVSPGGVACWDGPGKLARWDFGQKKFIPLPASLDHGSLPVFSPDGRYVLADSQYSKGKAMDFEVWDRKTNSFLQAKAFGFPGRNLRYDAQFPPGKEGVLIVRDKWEKKHWLVDLDSKKRTGPFKYGEVMTRQFTPTGDFYLQFKFEQKAKKPVWFPSKETACVLPNQVRIGEASCSNCGQYSEALDAASQKNLDALVEHGLCESAFDERGWEKLAPSMANGVIPREKALLYWKRFQKPGGFDSRKHMPIMIALLKDGFHYQDPEGRKAAFQNVLANSEPAFDSLLHEFPELLDLPPKGTRPSKICRNAADDKKLLQAAKDRVEHEITRQGRRSTFSDWKPLSLLTPLLAKASTAEKDRWIDAVAQSMADAAADDYLYRGLFVSKVYRFTSQAAARLFGVDSPPITDLTLVRDRQGVVPHILRSISSDEKEAKNEKGLVSTYGFQLSQLPRISVPVNKAVNPVFYDSSISWKHEGKTYSAKIKLKQNEVKKSLVPLDKGPRYNEAWADGRLSGAVVTGANLHTVDETLGDYKAYYASQGFVFPKTRNTEVVDLEHFLKSGIETGDLDYLVKEAHSDGDEKNLFKINTKATIETGARTVVNPATNAVQVETISLVYPVKSSGEKRIGNDAFGQWIQNRAKAPAGKNGQFTYFNTSCWSQTKAINEIEAAASDTLLDLPTTSLTLAFRNNPTSGVYLLLNAYRNKRDYDAIRKDLEKNPGYKEKQKNRFIFPDEEAYAQGITNIVQYPISTDIQIRDSQGNPYHMDQKP